MRASGGSRIEWHQVPPGVRTAIEEHLGVALVFDDVEGRQPHEPWTDEDLDLVIPAVRSFTEATTPSP